MRREMYRLELPGDWIDFPAETDMAASVFALEYLKSHRIPKTSLNLFRLPIMWVQHRCELIDVILFRFIPELK